MNWIDEAIQAFGKQIGINDLRLNERGVCCLVMEKSGELYFERGKENEELIIYLSRPITNFEEDILEAALAATNYKNIKNFVFSVGLSNNMLSFYTIIDSKDYSLSSLNKAVEFLQQVHDAIRK